MISPRLVCDLGVGKRRLASRCPPAARARSRSPRRGRCRPADSAWRLTVTVSETPRFVELLGDLVAPSVLAVPRSIVLRHEVRQRRVRRAGRRSSPARSDGVNRDRRRGVRDCLAMTTAPLSRHLADGRETALAGSSARQATRHAARTSPPCGSWSTSRTAAAARDRRRRRHRVDPLDAATRTSRHAGDRLEVAELVRDVRDAVVLEHQPRAKLVLRPLQLVRGDASRRGRDRSPASSAVLERSQRRPVGRRRRDRVEKRLLRRHQRRRTPTTRGRCSTSAPIQARAALRRRRAKARPQVEPFGAGQHGVEHEQREEIRDRRLPARGTPSFR